MFELDSWKVPMQVDKLLEVLKKNRKKHVADYEEALEKFRNEAAAILRIRAERVNRMKPADILKFEVPVPVTYQTVYDRVIGMLEMTNAHAVEITGKQFAEWVEDKWDWQESFISFYK